MRPIWSTMSTVEKAKNYEYDRFEQKHGRFRGKRGFSIGDKVLAYNAEWKNGRLKKLGPSWRGPFEIIARVSRSMWTVRGVGYQTLGVCSGRRSPVFRCHSSQIKHFYE